MQNLEGLQCESWREKTTMMHKLARLPLYLLLKILPIRVYDQIAFRYWKALVVLENHLFKKSQIREGY
jgi:hypothetical protein